MFGLGLHLSIVTLMNHDTFALIAFALIAFALACVSLYPLFLFRPRLRQMPIRLGRSERSRAATG